MEQVSQEKLDRTQDMAKMLAMSYITASISVGYLDNSIDAMKDIGVFRREVKHRINHAQHYFDFYNQGVKWVFNECGADAKELLCDDMAVLQEACDRFMNAGVRVGAYRAWNDDNLRQDGEYLCRVDGANNTDSMFLRWEQLSRVWQMYVASNYGSGWQALAPGIKVTEVYYRKPLHTPGDDETSKNAI